MLLHAWLIPCLATHTMVINKARCPLGQPLPLQLIGRRPLLETDSWQCADRPTRSETFCETEALISLKGEAWQGCQWQVLIRSGASLGVASDSWVYSRVLAEVDGLHSCCFLHLRSLLSKVLARKRAHCCSATHTCVEVSLRIIKTSII